jgi:hypothetical protein
VRYFTDVGPDRGPLLYGSVPGAIGVLDALDRPMPVGMALSAGWDDQRRAVWRLAVDGDDVPGRWIVIDREFRPAG